MVARECRPRLISAYARSTNLPAEVESEFGGPVCGHRCTQGGLGSVFIGSKALRLGGGRKYGKAMSDVESRGVVLR